MTSLSPAQNVPSSRAELEASVKEAGGWYAYAKATNNPHTGWYQLADAADSSNNAIIQPLEKVVVSAYNALRELPNMDAGKAVNQGLAALDRAGDRLADAAKGVWTSPATVGENARNAGTLAWNGVKAPVLKNYEQGQYGLMVGAALGTVVNAAADPFKKGGAVLDIVDAAADAGKAAAGTVGKAGAAAKSNVVPLRPDAPPVGHVSPSALVANSAAKAIATPEDELLLTFLTRSRTNTMASIDLKKRAGDTGRDLANVVMDAYEKKRSSKGDTSPLPTQNPLPTQKSALDSIQEAIKKVRVPPEGVNPNTAAQRTLNYLVNPSKLDENSAEFSRAFQSQIAMRLGKYTPEEIASGQPRPSAYSPPEVAKALAKQTAALHDQAAPLRNRTNLNPEETAQLAQIDKELDALRPQLHAAIDAGVTARTAP